MNTANSYPDVNQLLSTVRADYEKNRMSTNKSYVKLMLNHLQDFDIVSFDVFGTVVTRLVECPIDVFAFVEAKLASLGYTPAAGFAKNRLLAEQQARNAAYDRNKAEEISIDEIYHTLVAHFDYTQDFANIAKSCEQNSEVDLCVAISDHFELISQLKKLGKTIIFVSDMYLHPQNVEKILKTNGFDNYDHLFVSSHLGKTKHSGKIWTAVRNVIGNDKKIFHFGDNIHADVITPNKYGIQTQHYDRFLNERRVGAELDPNLLPFSFLAQATKLRQNPNFDAQKQIWSSLGASLGSMILYSFTNWLAKQIEAHKIDHVFFCARDAQAIHKAWHLQDFDNKIGCTSSYLYVSRRVLRYSLCYTEIVKNKYLSEASLNFIINESCEPGDSYSQIFKPFNISQTKIYQDGFKAIFGSLESKIDWSRVNEIKNYIQEFLLDDLLPVFKQVFDNTTNYYHQEGLISNDNKIAIVDLGWNGTIQMSIASLRSYFDVDSKVYGYYYGLFRQNTTGRLYKNGPMTAAFWNKFLRQDETHTMINSINLLENFHSADHQTTIDFYLSSEDNRYHPALKEDKDHKYINSFNETIKLFQDAALQGISEWISTGSHMGISADSINIISANAAMAQVFCSPNKNEIEALGAIEHSTLHNHDEFHRIIPNHLPTKQDQISDLLHRGGWPVGVMTHWVNLGIKEKNPVAYQVARQHFDSYSDLIKSKF